jgi:CDGSH-type Zn-finger protein
MSYVNAWTRPLRTWRPSEPASHGWHPAAMSDSAQEVAVEIRVQPNGPYEVTGPVALRRRRQVESEHGEPMAWQTTERLETGTHMRLCRCGGSAAKPFCDGTHRANDFDGTEAAPTATYDERARVYEGTGIVMRDDRGLCEHAGFCGNRLTNVWKMMKADVVQDSIARAQLISMIEHCPSGALTFRLTADEPDVEPELPVAIGVVDDGPLFVTGGVSVTRSDGEPFETRNRMTLCRCGASDRKPLCDGAHKKVDFRDR